VLVGDWSARVKTRLSNEKSGPRKRDRRELFSQRQRRDVLQLRSAPYASSERSFPPGSAGLRKKPNTAAQSPLYSTFEADGAGVLGSARSGIDDGSAGVAGALKSA
jgi:hypothetical protein